MPVEQTLDLETRKRVYDAIASSPGMHLRELSRVLDMPLGTLRYNLSYLEKHELIMSQMDARYKRYFPRRLSPLQKKVLAKLRREVPRGIVLYLLMNPNSRHSDILANFDLSPSTVTYYIKRLISDGIIVRSGEHDHYYSVVNSELVIGVLLNYRQTFKDYLLDKFIDTILPGQPEARDAKKDAMPHPKPMEI